ncbi:acid-resistance membrane protein [Botrimarina colliarenosi]|uniref:Acid-resistance membrane protein n=1 Tax=Botrimarina colliarenosi TaxID=2528001 RepID=A0A5C6ADN8_9BACT|nr:DUF308 domain-containing protein [Botrimarina colliarenosi]TWT97739.1 acid-resistance membrane protein [Botrimarina colliarenosi]
MADALSTAATPPTGGLTPNERDAVIAIAELWWIPLVRGMMLVALGGYALLTPGVTVMAYAFVIGAFVLADGVLAVLAGVLGWVASRWWALLRGVICIVAGLFVLAHPAFVGVIAVTTLVILLAIQSIVGGVLEIIAAVQERKQIEGEWWLILGGLLSIVFGAILLSAPLLSGGLLVQVLGVFAMIAGSVLIVASFRLRSFGKRQEALSA